MNTEERQEIARMLAEKNQLQADLAAAEEENTGLLQELDDYIRIRKINVKRLGEFEEENGRLRALLVRASGFAYHFGPAILKADIRAAFPNECDTLEEIGIVDDMREGSDE